MPPVETAIIFFTDFSYAFEIVHGAGADIAGSANDQDGQQIISAIFYYGPFEERDVHLIGAVGCYPTDRIGAQSG